MIALAIAYALVAAAVFGWLLHTTLTAESPIDYVPARIMILLSVFWGVAFVIAVLSVVGWAMGAWWTQRAANVRR